MEHTQPNTPLEVLRAARVYLADPTHWNHDGRGTAPLDGVPCAKRCAIAALVYAAPADGPGHSWAATDAAQRALEGAMRAVDGSRPWAGAAEWNDRDGRTHVEVLEAFDRAIGGLPL